MHDIGVNPHRVLGLLLVAFLMVVAVMLFGGYSALATTPVSGSQLFQDASPLSIYHRLGATKIHDTYLDQDQPGENFSDATQLLIDQARTLRPLYHIDVGSVITGPAEIERAVLTLHILEPYGHKGRLSVCAYEVLRHWVVTETTWYSATASNLWYSLGCDLTEPPVFSDRSSSPVDCQEFYTGTLQDGIGIVEFDLTSLVQEWVDDPNQNHGFILLGEGQSSVRWRIASAEHGVESHRPFMDVVWLPTTPTCTPTPIPTLTPSATSSPTPTLTPTSALSRICMPLVAKNWAPRCMNLVDDPGFEQGGIDSRWVLDEGSEISLVAMCSGDYGARLIRMEHPPEEGAIYQDIPIPLHVSTATFAFHSLLFYHPGLVDTPVPGEDWKFEASLSWLPESDGSPIPILKITEQDEYLGSGDLDCVRVPAVPLELDTHDWNLENGQLRLRFWMWSRYPKKIWLAIDDVELNVCYQTTESP